VWAALGCWLAARTLLLGRRWAQATRARAVQAQATPAQAAPSREREPEPEPEPEPVPDGGPPREPHR
jgi:hypothetical protein